MQDVKHKICDLMNNLQRAISDTETDVFQEDYLEDVKRRIGLAEKELAILKNELMKHIKKV